MSETTPATTPSKSFLLSKTFWIQVIAALSTFFPQVRSWIAANPESAVGALAALNVIVRFVTSGKVSFFPPEYVEKPSGPAGGLNLLWIAAMGMTAAAMGMGLPSCSSAQLAAARAVPIRACVITPQGKVCYSSKTGIDLRARVQRDK